MEDSMAVGDVYKTRKGNEKVRFESTTYFHITDFMPEQCYGWQEKKGGRRRYVEWSAGVWKAVSKPSRRH